MVVRIQSGEAKKLINQGIVRVLCGEEDYNLIQLLSANNTYCFTAMRDVGAEVYCDGESYNCLPQFMY